MTEIDAADVRKSLTQAIIVLQKITKENVVVDDPNININQKSPRNILGIIIQTRLMTVPIQSTVVFHELLCIFFFFQIVFSNKVQYKVQLGMYYMYIFM